MNHDVYKLCVRTVGSLHMSGPELSITTIKALPNIIIFATIQDYN